MGYYLRKYQTILLPIYYNDLNFIDVSILNANSTIKYNGLNLQHKLFASNFRWILSHTTHTHRTNHFYYFVLFICDLVASQWQIATKFWSIHERIYYEQEGDASHTNFPLIFQFKLIKNSISEKNNQKIARFEWFRDFLIELKRFGICIYLRELKSAPCRWQTLHFKWFQMETKLKFRNGTIFFVGRRITRYHCCCSIKVNDNETPLNMSININDDSICFSTCYLPVKYSIFWRVITQAQT